MQDIVSMNRELFFPRDNVAPATWLPSLCRTRARAVTLCYTCALARIGEAVM